MKKFWKKICLGALVVASVFCVSACGKKDANVSQDLDGDGQIATWETLYETKGESARQVAVEKIVEIRNLSELRAIDSTATNTAYVLRSDIDCGGESVCINLGATNYLYGNNHVISNYNLGKTPDSMGEENTLNANALICYGAGVYDLRLFMGIEEFYIGSAIAQTFYATNFYHVSVIDSVEVKGAINVTPNQDANSASINLSLLSCEKVDTSNVIRNANVYGKINYSAIAGASKENAINIGGVAVSASSSSEISNVNVDAIVDVALTLGSLPIKVGMVSSVNEGFITSATANGAINIKYEENPLIYVGGIVATNNKWDTSVSTFGVAEIRNSTSNVSINIDGTATGSAAKNVYVGGIAGISRYGFIDYSVNNGPITASFLRNAKIGGIVGLSDKSTLDTLISRGAINLTSVDSTEVAEIAGFSTGGIMKHILATTPITIDNSARQGAVRLGMGTIFEASSKDGRFTTTQLGESGEDEEITIYFYNTANSPMFDGILIGGTNVVTRDSKGSLTVDLGLRDVYYTVEEETSNPDGEYETTEKKLVTQVPYLYDDLYYLSNYRITENVIAGGNTETKNIPMTNAIVNGSNRVKAAADSVVYRPDWFVKNLGFNYGLNHHEVDLSGVKINEKAPSLDTIKFTLSEEVANTRYFEKKKYNGELQYFDQFIDTAYIYTENEPYSSNDEFLSFVVDLIAQGENLSMKSVLITEDYFKDYSVEDHAIGMEYFKNNIQSMLEKIYEAPILTFINEQIQTEDGGVEEGDIQKLECSIEENGRKYVITFDFINALDEGEPYFRFKNPYQEYSSSTESGFYYMVNVMFEVL